MTLDTSGDPKDDGNRDPYRLLQPRRFILVNRS